jgi:hypothetical protein
VLAKIIYSGGIPKDVLGTQPFGVLKKPPCADDTFNDEVGVNTGAVGIGVTIG